MRSVGFWIHIDFLSSCGNIVILIGRPGFIAPARLYCPDICVSTSSPPADIIRRIYARFNHYCLSRSNVNVYTPDDVVAKKVFGAQSHVNSFESDCNLMIFFPILFIIILRVIFIFMKLWLKLSLRNESFMNEVRHEVEDSSDFKES